jgi:hypothetical protein
VINDNNDNNDIEKKIMKIIVINENNVVTALGIVWGKKKI